MTQTEAFEAKLSRSMDATPLRGKAFLLPGIGATPATILSLTPLATGFGARVNAMAGIFTRYRFKYLKIKFLGSNPTGGGASSFISLGVVDDTTGIPTDFPTTLDGVAQLRCSGTVMGVQTIPTQFEWSPVDKRRWFYTQSDGTDTRFSNSGALVLSGLASNYQVAVELDYCIVFEGAADVAA
jgi:hypothetical protein